jgi:flagellar motor switch protein FliM
MTAQGSPSVLERKLAAASQANRATGRSALRALRLALARTARDLFDLPLAVIGAKQARCDHAGLARFLGEDQLLVLLDGSDGLAGAVSLDGACVAALIQQQTMSRVTGTAMAERAFTGTDAALAEHLIETLLSRAAELADLPEDRRCLSGFRFGARVEDIRSLELTLDADRFRVFSLTVDIAEGAMQGAICLLLPDLPADPVKPGTKGGQAVAPGPRMDQAFGVMRADLTATICRLRLPLSELAAMQPGDVLPLMRERLEETELIAINGRPVAAGRLGQINGLRALRLNETVSAHDPLDSPTENGFASRVVVDEPDGDGPLTLDGSVVHPEEALPQQAGLPAVIDAGGSGNAATQQDSDSANLLDHMTPEEAAAEISQLAGLSAQDTVE